MDHHVGPVTQHRAQLFTGDIPPLLELLVWN
jgi:hypothetical protein